MPAPYAVSSDLVSAWPSKSLDVAQYIDNYVPLLAMPQNPQIGTTYTLAATDTTKLVTFNNGSPVAVTLPLESTVAWATGTQLRLMNLGAGTVTLAGAVGVTINGTPLTLAQYKAADLIKVGTNQWVFAPFSGAGRATVSATTGSPAITTVAGKSVYDWTGAGTITIGASGYADIVVCAGGGGAVDSGGGGGGGVIRSSAYFSAGDVLTVAIGGGGTGGTSGTNGSASQCGAFYALGGGGGGRLGVNGKDGGTGGGGSGTGVGGSPILGQGLKGGNGISSSGGGGGGATTAGSNAASGTAGGAGGAPYTELLTGTSKALGAGGGSASGGAAGGTGAGAGNTTSGNAGTINTGGGGGGGYTTAGGNGGSGRVIIAF